MARLDGYAVCVGELEDSLYGASAAVLSEQGRPLAIVSVWGPERRVPKARLAGDRRARRSTRPSQIRELLAMSHTLISLRREGAVCIVQLERPEKLNALSGALERELRAALGEPELATSGAVVLTGSGRAFSAGADISEFADRDPEAILAYYRETGGVYEAIAALAAADVQRDPRLLPGRRPGAGARHRLPHRRSDRGLRLPRGRPRASSRAPAARTALRACSGPRGRRS